MLLVSASWLADFLTFKPHDVSTRIKSAVAGHLPIYHGGVGLGEPIATDHHANYVEAIHFYPSWRQLNAIQRGLPTVLFKDEECFMLLQCNHTSGSSYDFEGYELDGKAGKETQSDNHHNRITPVPK